MLSNDEIDFFMSIFDNQADLINRAEKMDAVMNSNVSTCLKYGIPPGSSVIKRQSNNTKLATFIVNLFKPLNLLRDFMKTKYSDMEVSVAGCLTRKNAKENQDKVELIMRILDKSYELYVNLEKDAVAKK